ncbi:MAG: hemolysin family protein [Clostridia bacterium]
MISQLIFLVILIMLNAYFAATEIAFISLNDAKIEKQAKEGNKKAKQIQKMLKNPSKFLATIQIGITLAGFLSSAFASDAFADKLAPVLNNLMPFLSIGIWRNISIVIITLILSFFTLVFGELVPKRLAMKYYEKISYATIGVIKTISIITAPFVKLLTWSTNMVSKIFRVGEQEEEIVTEEEIKMMVDQGEEKGSIEETEKQLINNVFEFNDIVASEIMTHRVDMYAIEINQNLYDILDEIDEYKYSRIPVYEESIDNIKGILFLKDVLKLVSMRKEIKIKDILREAYFVPETKPINEIFEELQVNKRQMAIVVDEYGGTAGVLTMEDILEELVGNIFDEYDDVEIEYKKLDDNTYLIEGSVSLYELKRILDVELPEGDYETLSGYLIEKIGRLPNENENLVIEDEHLTYKIEEYEDKRIKWVKVCKNKQEILNENEK